MLKRKNRPHAVNAPSTPKQDAAPAGHQWWGLYDLPAEQARTWSVGPLQTVLCCQSQEIKVYSRDNPDAGEDRVQISPPAPLSEALPQAETFVLVRHILEPAATQIEILPALADRAVVSKPLHRFVLHSRQRVKVFVSSPLWWQARLPGSSALLADMPVIRPSDTWFGSSTRQGDLCYASRTHARLNLDEIPVSPIRAITQVELQNNSDKPLSVEKICLPVSFLSLFACHDGRLWTESVTIACEQHNEPSAVTIERAPFSDGMEMQALTAPREHARSGLVHSLNVLFG